jgi:tRNA(Ile)-lysidine synthase
MALLHAAAHAGAPIAAVAVFDHATGPASHQAALLVSSYTRSLGVRAIIGRAATPARTEAGWRQARWAFLRDVAREARASIVTAHTRDDQVETVVMRILRGAGARGLAGLYADSDIKRPLIDVRRQTINAYVREHAIPTVDDPSNVSRAHLRNRVRLDFLPAVRAARPAFEDELLALARAAAEWRRSIERVVRDCWRITKTDDGHAVAAADLAGYDPESLGIIWPVIAARAGVTLDRRGTSRLVAFTNGGRVGASIQLSGGIEVQRTRFYLVFRALRVATGR